MKRLSTFISLLFALTCAAQNSLVVEAPSVVAMDETFRIVFTADGRMSDFNWPGTTDFDIVWGPQQGSMSSTSIVNGKRTSTHQETVTYLLQPKAKGKFALSGATAKIDKKECSSRSFTIEVVDSQTSDPQSYQQNQQPDQQRNQQQNSPQTTGTVSGENIFLKLSVSKTSAVKGEPITATLKIYTREEIAGFEDIKFPTFNGFWSKETVSVQNLEFKRENVNGQIYNAALIRKYMLIPQQSGNIAIEPAEMVCQLRVRTAGGGRSIFDDFFDTYQTIRKRLYSDKVTIHVKDLPAGAPASFGGGVGDFKISASLSKNDIKSNEAASLIVTVSGRGNISMIEAPTVKFPGDFEIYDIKSSESISADGTSGTKTFEYPFIPRSHGDFTIEPVTYSYYDIGKGRYVTVSTDAINLTIAKGEDVADGGLVTPGINRQGVKNLSEDIRYIALGDGGFRAKDRFFAGSPLFFILLAVLVVLFFILDKVLKMTEDRRADIVGNKNRRANKMARSRLKAAEDYMKQNLGGAYYEELHKALLGYVSDKLAIQAAEISKESISQALLAKGVSHAAVESLIKLVDKCEFARYSPESEQVQMENEYNEAIRIISQIESEVKKSKKPGKGAKSLMIATMLTMSFVLADAQEPADLWKNGNEAFAQEQWQDALNSYKSIEDQGLQSADLYYNMGNAYFKLGDTPHAILYFERAIKLNPSHKDARNNLEIASQFTLDKIDKVPEFVLLTWTKRLRQSLSADNWAWITLLLGIVIVALMLLFKHSYSGKIRKISFITACVIFAVAIATFIFSISGKNAIMRVDHAIVMSPVSSVKSSPSDAGNAIFVLHEGTKVKLLDEVGEWSKIELSDGRQGWLKKSTVEGI